MVTCNFIQNLTSNSTVDGLLFSTQQGLGHTVKIILPGGGYNQPVNVKTHPDKSPNAKDIHCGM